ncbi:hypothetical protein BB561_004734 [Smittium simulii]|uniref:Transcription initiation factor IIA large subunit n=1 Tax=Smittium simulii TaxID=133385 RepID=A0A2T9YEK7_9FUNG|nr:hypothetical protein BB561_004734 [Smittium simulii]
MSSLIVASIYQQVINDVIHNIQRDFEDSGVDVSVLNELQQLWETKIIQSRVTNFPPEDDKNQLEQEEDMENSSKRGTNKQKAKARSKSYNQNLSVGNINQDESEDELSDANSVVSNKYPENETKFTGQSAASLASIINTSNTNNMSANTGYPLSPSQRKNNAFEEDYDDQNSSTDDESQNQPLSTRAPQFLASGVNAPLASMSPMMGQRNLDQAQQNSSKINDLLNNNATGNDYMYQSLGSNSLANNNSQDTKKPYLPQNDGCDDPISVWKIFLAERKLKQLNSANKLDSTEQNKDFNMTISQVDGDNSENGGDITEHMVLCQYDKVSRTKNKWKCVLKDGIMLVNGRNYLFHKANGDFEW